MNPFVLEVQSPEVLTSELHLLLGPHEFFSMPQIYPDVLNHELCKLYHKHLDEPEMKVTDKKINENIYTKKHKQSMVRCLG